VEKSDQGRGNQDRLNVGNPQDIRPTLQRAKVAIKNGKPAVVNVVTDFAARATTVRFTKTST
jgi:acetolactate synthase-1/2/3 large subunit